MDFTEDVTYHIITGPSSGVEQSVSNNLLGVAERISLTTRPLPRSRPSGSSRAYLAVPLVQRSVSHCLQPLLRFLLQSMAERISPTPPGSRACLTVSWPPEHSRAYLTVSVIQRSVSRYLQVSRAQQSISNCLHDTAGRPP